MRILVIRPGALGDVLLTLPVLQALRDGFPQAQIDLMGDLSVAGWLVGRSAVGAVLAYDLADLAALFQSGGGHSDSVRGLLAQFDVVLSYATPAGHVFARNLASVAAGRVLSLDARPGSVMGMHMSNYLQQPLRLLGVPASDSPPRLCLKAVDERQADQWWMEHGLGDARVLCLHPGSGSPAKNWPAQRFAEVALCAQRELGLRVVLIHGPADGVAVSDVQTYVQDLDHSVLRDLPLPLLAAILARCTAYVGNDSGVSHMAAALGVPTVAIFGPTDPEVWAPRGPSAHIVAGGASCAPCRPQEWRGCDLRECLSDVTTNAVIGELKGALALEHKAEGERPQRGEGGHAL